MRYNVRVFKEIAEMDITANSAVEAEELVKDILPGDENFILKIKAEPKIVVLNNKVSILEG